MSAPLSEGAERAGVRDDGRELEWMGPPDEHEAGVSPLKRVPLADLVREVPR